MGWVVGDGQGKNLNLLDMPTQRVIFFITADVHILDLAGALQAFYEAAYYGQPYDIMYISDRVDQVCSAQLQLASLKIYTTVDLSSADILIIPGFDLRQLKEPVDEALTAWLRKADAVGTTICSVCTGAFALARAGLLDNRECTTHWKYTELLQREFPALRVLINRLFVKSDHIYTSAGVTTGVDMALFLLEWRHGAEFAYRVARELVVYIRRDGGEGQESIYLQYRRHLRDDIHAIQDWIVGHLQEKIRVEDLAAMIHTSPRNLTRLFKMTTGITIGQYLEKLRVEKALHLLHQDTKIGTIARQCGLQSDNQLRQMIKRHTGRLPSAARK
jgi:transcriptional regulator GlxA family with amidase domain